MVAEQEQRWQVTGSKGGKPYAFPVLAYTRGDAMRIAKARGCAVASCALVTPPAERERQRRQAIAAFHAL